MIVFSNTGLIDIKAIQTFGASSKLEGAIGYFGTGLKYAIAIALRENCGVTLYRGTKEYRFAIRREKIQRDHFPIVTMNNRRLPFTTELGKDWELWQAFRELYCNASDEGGGVSRKLVIAEGVTNIVIEGMENEYADRHTTILTSTAIAVHNNVEIHPGPSEYLYYKGIRIMDYVGEYTYNFTNHVTLTEDRTVSSRYYITEQLAGTVTELDDPTIIKNILCSTTLDQELNFMYQTFEETCTKVIGDNLQDVNMNHSAVQRYCRLNRGTLVNVEISTLNQKRMNRAIEFLKNAGYPITNYEIIVTDAKAFNTLGQAENGKIYISVRCFELGTKTLASTLLEEYTHLKENLYDETRDLQTHLFDKILSLLEESTGEIL